MPVLGSSSSVRSTLKVVGEGIATEWELIP